MRSVLIAAACVGVAVIGAAAPAHADRTELAMEVAFHEGRYDEAAVQATAFATADAHAFAARALLAKAMCGTGQPPGDLLAEARSLAKAALDLDPDHIEGRLQLAIARSLIARPMSTRAALRAGHGGASRDLAQSVLRDDPGNAYAHGFLAVWHIEVFRRGGRLGAAFMGADMDDARTHYERAARALPGDASVHWQYARALAALNAKRYRKDIDRALAAALNSPHETALEQVMANRAAILKRALVSEDRRSVQALAADML